MTSNVFVSKKSILELIPRSLPRDNFLTAPASDVYYPILSLRTNPNRERAILNSVLLSAYASVNFFWALFLNDPEITLINGEDKASWQDYDPPGTIQYDFSRDNTNFLTFNINKIVAGGVQFSSVPTNILSKEDFYIELGRDTQGNSQELIFAISVKQVGADMAGAFNFLEVI